MTKIVMVSAAHNRLAGFMEALQTAAGAPIQLAPTAEAALAVAQKSPPVVMVIDQHIDRPAFALVKEIMTVNALIHTAVISEQSADAFHDTAEGLGILMQLPNPPGNADASALWKRLIDIGAAS
jgi:DNA-binding NarL/FixJ family response regulator